MEAAASVRDQDGRTADVRNLFHHAGGRYAERMSLAASPAVGSRVYCMRVAARRRARRSRNDSSMIAVSVVPCSAAARLAGKWRRGVEKPVVESDGGTHHFVRSGDASVCHIHMSICHPSGACAAETGGVLCLEEPENGIHPARIPAILQLLRDIAVDTSEPVGPENPLRQVIVNTHSPAVFQEVPDGSVVFVKTREAMGEREHLFKKAHFHCLSDTWRAKDGGILDVAARGDLLSYLNPVVRRRPQEATAKERRVVDRDDLQQLLPFPPSS